MKEEKHMRMPPQQVHFFFFKEVPTLPLGFIFFLFDSPKDRHF